MGDGSIDECLIVFFGWFFEDEAIVEGIWK